MSSIEPPKRFLSLHWKLLFTLVLLGTVILSIQLWNHYQHFTHSNLVSAQQRHQLLNDTLEDILTTEQRALSKLAHTLILPHTNVKDIKKISRVFQQYWPDLNEQWQINGMAVLNADYSPQLQEGKFPDLQKLHIWLVSLKQTIGNTLICEEQCFQIVAAPIMNQQKLTGHLLLFTSLKNLTRRFTKQTKLPMSILQVGASPYVEPDIPEWQVRFFNGNGHLTPADTNIKALLQRLSEKTTLRQATRSDHTIIDQQRHWGISILSSPLSENQALYFATLYNRGTEQKPLLSYIKKQLILASGSLLVILTLIWISSWRDIRRLNNLIEVFPMLGQRLFQEARTKISKHSQDPRFRDEIDLLDEATTTLSYQLESLEKAVNIRTEEMEKLSLLDSLTGLANRHLFQYELENEVSKLKATGPYLCVVMLDLDNFKRINDSLGHQQGDFLLSHIAKRLKHASRQLGLVARLGGDEFAIIMPNIKQVSKANLICQKILDLIKKPIKINEQELFTSCSIGLVITQKKLTVTDLIKNAELAMYKAKESGGDCYQTFKHTMATEASETLSLEREIRRALEEQEFTLYLQPKVDMDGNIQGFESLIRWDHPDRGILPPSEFIPAMESLGLISEIDKFVLDVSCRQLKVLENLYADISIAVNISSTHFTERSFFTYLKTCLARYPIHPNRLELEITETLLMENMSAGLEVINQIKELGVSIAIDDFGTGYSSLSYLKKLPVDTLKIDREFIKDIPDSESDMQISSIIIFLAKQLNFKVVAEGVETSEQLVFLKANQCDLAQGFYFSKPVPAHQALLLLESERLNG
jgi:diguanylate cyclase (GGDEF)-like protein